MRSTGSKSDWEYDASSPVCWGWEYIGTQCRCELSSWCLNFCSVEKLSGVPSLSNLLTFDQIFWCDSPAINIFETVCTLSVVAFVVASTPQKIYKKASSRIISGVLNSSSGLNSTWKSNKLNDLTPNYMCLIDHFHSIQSFHKAFFVAHFVMEWPQV